MFACARGSFLLCNSCFHHTRTNIPTQWMHSYTHTETLMKEKQTAIMHSSVDGRAETWPRYQNHFECVQLPHLSLYLKKYETIPLRKKKARRTIPELPPVTVHVFWKAVHTRTPCPGPLKRSRLASPQPAEIICVYQALRYFVDSYAIDATPQR